MHDTKYREISVRPTILFETFLQHVYLTKYNNLLLNKRRLPRILVLTSASQDEDHFENWGDGKITLRWILGKYRQWEVEGNESVEWRAFVISDVELRVLQSWIDRLFNDTRELLFLFNMKGRGGAGVINATGKSRTTRKHVARLC
jgi:hypothetical protein